MLHGVMYFKIDLGLILSIVGILIAALSRNNEEVTVILPQAFKTVIEELTPLFGEG